MAASLVGGAALGAVFGELLKAVWYEKDKATKFQPTLANLTRTLRAIDPLIKEMEQQNDELGRPKEELESLIREMKKGTKLVYKCLKISRVDIIRRRRYQKKLAALAKSVESFFKIDMLAQAARDVKEMLLEVRRMKSKDNKLHLSRTVTSSHNSAGQAVEVVISLSQIMELLRAPRELLGETKYGSSYKASLRDGTTLVLKSLTNVSVGQEEFGRQIEAAHKLSRHPNVMPLRAWYCSNDEKLLICDYMAAGNLSELLHGITKGWSTQLAWRSRMKISLGVAKGIAHIHSANGGQFCHGNISSYNVLLTVDLQVRISDHAISRLVSAPIFLQGRDCYHAPEVIRTKELTQKSDVYSFGILLLEILTVESPLDEDFPSWVQSKAMDDNIYFSNLWNLVVSCLGEHPESRPSMDEVVREMEEIN